MEKRAGRLVETATQRNTRAKDEKTRCAICLACFVEKTKTTKKKDEEEEEEEDALCYAGWRMSKDILYEA